MFSIDFESPRFKSALRTLQYVFLTVFVVAGTIILVYAGQGYDINRRTGELIQNGLLLVNTSPDGSVVFIDGQAESDLTPSRFPLPAGDYDIRIEQAGYLPWQKQIPVIGSQVEWLYYPILIPEQLITENVSALSNVEFIRQSADGSRFLVRQKGDGTVFHLFSIEGSALTDDERLTLPVDTFELRNSSGRFGSFSFEGWASDNQTVLLRHSVGRQVEYILFDIQQPSESVNVSRQFDLDLRDARFINGQASQLYALVGGDLRRFDLQSDTLSAPIIRDVSRYVLYEDQYVIYIRNDDTDGLLLGMVRDDGQSAVIERLSGTTNDYRLEFASYDDEFHLALLDRSEDKLTLVIDPQSLIDNDQAQIESTQVDVADVQYISFSRNGQFISAQSGSSFYTYDFDRNRTHNFTIDVRLPADYEVEWLNGTHLVAHDRTDRLFLFEFDGGNIRPLVNAHPDFGVFTDNAAETLYTLSPTGNSDRVFLQSTNLLAETPS